MHRYFKLFFYFFIFTADIYGKELIDKYPSYTYIFNEFDIDKEYIYDSSFNDFALKNEKGLKLFYKRSLQRGKDVLPTMKDLLMGEGVSDLFIYLAMIESGLSSVAVSPKKAVGLWQFMPKTAQMYNLTVSHAYDERHDTVSATSAAINYLNKLHRQFGKWYVAAMAYNCGEGCMQRAIRRAGTDELSVLIDEDKRYLPKETREYIKKIVLVAMIGENMSLDFDDNIDSLENGFIEVEISSKTSLKEIAKLIKMKTKVLQKLNAKMMSKKKIYKRKTRKIMIPIAKVFAFYLRYELNQNIKEVKPYLLSHYVEMGETLNSISKIYNANSEDIRNVNNIENDYLILRQLLLIPVNRGDFEKVLKSY